MSALQHAQLQAARWARVEPVACRPLGTAPHQQQHGLLASLALPAPRPDAGRTTFATAELARQP